GDLLIVVGGERLSVAAQGLRLDERAPDRLAASLERRQTGAKEHAVKDEHQGEEDAGLHEQRAVDIDDRSGDQRFGSDGGGETEHGESRPEEPPKPAFLGAGVWRFGALATTGSRGRQRWPRVDSPHVCDAGVGPRLRFGAAGFGRNGALRSRLRNRALFELHPTVALEDRSFFDLEVRRAQVAVHLRRRANLDVVAGDDVASNLALDHDGGGDDFGSHECAGPDDQRPTGMDLTRELPIDADSPFEGELAFEGAPGSEDGGRV